MGRFSFGTPSWAVRSHRILPLLRSRQISFHCCGVTSSDASPSPYRPRLKEASGRLLTAVVTKIRSRHTMGLECARPGRAAVHWIWVPRAASHFTGRFWLSATPEAAGPRKEGQFCAAAAGTSAKSNAGNRRAMALMITPCYVIQVVGARVDVSLFTPCLNKESYPAFGLVDGELSRKPPMSSGSAHAAPAAPLRPQFP